MPYQTFCLHQRTGHQKFHHEKIVSRAFAAVICTEDFDLPGFCPYVLHKISVRDEPALLCLRYSLTDVPFQLNSHSGSIRRVGNGPPRPTCPARRPAARHACALSLYVRFPSTIAERCDRSNGVALRLTSPTHFLPP